MPSSKSSSPYSRFIPREEIEAVSTWRFDNVDGSPHPEDVAAAEAQAQAEAAAAAVSPEAIAANMEALRRQSVQEGFEQGHAAGCAETRAALEETTRLANEAANRRFEEALRALQQDWTHTQQHLAQAVLDMACALARQVVRRELQTDTASLLPVVQDAVAALVADAPSPTVRLHPDDLAALGNLAETLPGPQPIRCVADPSLTPGGCVVDAGGTEVDATLEKRWLRVINNLGLNTPWSVPDSPEVQAHDSAA